jgi:hypothetical protein
MDELTFIIDTIKKYKAKGNLEIELRFLQDARNKYPIKTKTLQPDDLKDLCGILINKYKDNPSIIDQSINLINNDNIKQISFNNGKQDPKHKHYIKERLLNPVFLTHNTSPDYKLSISDEIPTKEIPFSNFKYARIKLRYTIALDDWKLDLTLVKAIDNLQNNDLFKFKEKMLFPITKDNFIEKAPWSFCDTIEIELEYTGKIEELTINSFLIVDDIFDTDINKSVNKSNASDSKEASSITYQELIYKIAKYIKPYQQERFKHEYGIKQLSNQVIELNKIMYLNDVHNNITNYYITDKVDGKRTILYIDRESYAVSDILEKIDIESKELYIVDTEKYENNYYIFDVMVFKGKNISDKPFNIRLDYIEKVVELSSLLKSKPFIKLDDYRKQISDFKKEKKPYEIDGIILTPYDGLYSNMRVYKYKPIEKLTVDFLIKKCPDKMIGIKPYILEGKTLYLLFCGISKDVYLKLNMKLLDDYNEIFLGIDKFNLPPYFPIQFMPSSKTYAYLYWSDDEKLDGEVGEFSYKNNAWIMHKIRDDRRLEVKRGNYFGNNYKVAELTWMSYNDPLVIEEIDNHKVDDSIEDSKSDGKLMPYFQEHDNVIQKTSRNFNSYVKSEIFKKFQRTKWVMDLASGKGQDLFRYYDNEMENVIFLDVDKTALMELVTRKHYLAEKYDNRAKLKRHAKYLHRMKILVQNVNLLDKYKDIIESIENVYTYKSENIDLIMCNLAFHYLIKDKKSISNICKLINYYLKSKGKFIFTAFDGNRIVKLLKEHKGNWTIKAGKDIKYSIIKKYNANELDECGQKIDVLLPFSADTYYEEYLVNIDTIEAEFAKYGITLQVKESFDKYIDNYRKKDELDANDRLYVGLYHIYIFAKK